MLASVSWASVLCHSIVLSDLNALSHWSLSAALEIGIDFLTLCYIHSSAWSAVHKKCPGPGLASAASPCLTLGPAASHHGQQKGSPGSLTPVCPSLSDRLLQLQVMPLSRLHLRHFRRVQTCLVRYLLAPLLYPQVSPLPPSSHLHPPRKRNGWLSQLPGYARHLWDGHSLPVTLQVTLRSCHGQGVVCLPSSGMREAGNQSHLEPERSGSQMYSFGELSAHTAMWTSANPDWPAQPDVGKVGVGKGQLPFTDLLRPDW